MIPNSIFNQVFINCFPFCKEERAGLSFAFTEINLFSGKAKEPFHFSSLMLLISESLQGKSLSWKRENLENQRIFPIQFRQAKFCYRSHYTILQLKPSLHLSEPEENLTQYLILIAISKANGCMKGKKNPTTYPISAIKARMSKGSRISTAVAIVTHEL